MSDFSSISLVFALFSHQINVFPKSYVLYCVESSWGYLSLSYAFSLSLKTLSLVSESVNACKLSRTELMSTPHTSSWHCDCIFLLLIYLYGTCNHVWGFWWQRYLCRKLRLGFWGAMNLENRLWSYLGKKGKCEC